ncbi:hypothetical protein FRX31_027960 [Thalictrum thalictroides]|uniref:NAC domain-containing protein n=1 Tax=Thalictrum thalictroides TaxID=46969 RepID=A0A7J6VCU6_THATH|nr:hypothetical protein FRX31_027960 [Thalictrum thalictroides]
MSDVPPGFIAIPTEHGDLFLAIGFKFAPKDVELVKSYLKNKVYGRSMPCEVAERDNQILDMNHDKVLAYKNVLVFYQGDSPNGVMSKYVVEEYRLNPKVTAAHDINIRNNIEKLVLCKVQFQDIGDHDEESTV